MKALGIDIGGSSIKGVPVDTKTGRLLAESHRIEIDKGMAPEKVAGVVRDHVRHFRWKGPVGVGFPGVIEGGTIWTSANLHSRFVGFDGARLFGRATGCRVAMINDAAAAGIAEMRFGAGHGFMGKTLLVTLGTGVGTCLAYQGVVTALELGHFPWKGGRSAEKHVSAAVLARKKLSWAEWGGRLSEYLVEMERLLWPEMIVVGGAVSAEHRKFFRHLKTRARLAPAEFLNQAGAVGAAIWAVEAK